MKDRIVFFVLGAVLATIAYFAGDMNQATGQSGIRVIDENVSIKGNLHVKGFILIGDSSKRPDNSIVLTPGGEKPKEGPAILLSYEKDRQTKENAASVLIGTGIDDNGFPDAYILLNTIFDENVSMTARSGYNEH